MTKYLTIGLVVSVAAAALLGWLLLGAHEKLGEANLKAKTAEAAITLMQTQEQINQRLDAALEKAEQARSTVTREIIRDIWQAASTDACRKSPAMRALDGRLRYDPAGPNGGPAAPSADPQPVRPAR